MIQIRPRRLRTTPAMRRLVREVEPRASQLVLPVFVAEAPGAISSMPGVHRHDLEGLRYVTERVHTPVMADESVFGPMDVIELIRMRAADNSGRKRACRRVIAVHWLPLTSGTSKGCKSLTPRSISARRLRTTPSPTPDETFLA